MQKKINIGIIGAGNVAKHYLKIFNKGTLENYSIKSVCDLNIKSAKTLSEEIGCRYFGSIEEMLSEVNLDLALVLTPSGHHYKHAKLCLENNINVLVEKPVSNFPAQAQELEKIAKSKNKLIAVAFQNRLNPSIAALKKAIDRDRLGKIVTSTIRLRWCRYQNYYNDDWHGTWALDGGVINQQAIHHIDVLNWLIGPIEKVCSLAGNQLNKLEAEDTLVAIMKFKNGALGTIEATTAARPKDYEASLSVVGEKGLVVIGGIALNKIEMWNFVDPIPEDELIPDQCSIDVPSGYGLSHEKLLKIIINNLSNNSIESPVDIKGCIETCELIHALYSSNEKNSWVYLKDKPLSNLLGR